jgi:predicted  nucleic acid-binding Zn-ribbon protein
MDWIDLVTGGSVLMAIVVVVGIYVWRYPSIIAEKRKTREQEIRAESDSEERLMKTNEMSMDMMASLQTALSEISGAFKLNFKRLTEVDDRICELEREMEQLKQDHQREVRQLKAIIAEKEAELKEVRKQLADKDKLLEAERKAAKDRERELQQQIEELKEQLKAQNNKEEA